MRRRRRRRRKSRSRQAHLQILSAPLEALLAIAAANVLLMCC
jgi:hypothetical protein